MSQVGPLFGKLHDICTAVSVIVCHRNRFTDILFCNAQCLFYTQFYRQSVCIPSCFTFYLETFHRLEAAERIFNGTSHHVVNARHTVCRGRTFVEYERRMSLTFCHTAGENIVFIPFLQHFLVHVRKVELRIFSKFLLIIMLFLSYFFYYLGITSPKLGCKFIRKMDIWKTF